MKLGKWVKLTTAVYVALSLSACSFAPIVAQKLGVGTADEKDIVKHTAKVFSVPETAVKISDIKQDNTMNGSRVYFTAKVNGKTYNCGMVSSFASDSLPKCVKPGEPLSF